MRKIPNFHFLFKQDWYLICSKFAHKINFKKNIISVYEILSHWTLVRGKLNGSCVITIHIYLSYIILSRCFLSRFCPTNFVIFVVSIGVFLPAVFTFPVPYSSLYVSSSLITFWDFFQWWKIRFVFSIHSKIKFKVDWVETQYNNNNVIPIQGCSWD